MELATEGHSRRFRYFLLSSYSSCRTPVLPGYQTSEKV